MSTDRLPAISPADEGVLMSALAECREKDLPLALTGTGSKAGWGRPVEAAAQLHLGAAFAGIRFYEPDELVLCAGAATRLREIQALLDREGQMFAFEPPDLGPLWGGDAESGTLGGLIACNLAGPRRFKAGAARDAILGVRAVSGGALPYKAGGRVMKNVTGFDLPKLLCGSHGTLSVLTEVTLKVLPRPETERTLLLAGQGAAAAVAALAEGLNGPDEPSGAAYVPATVWPRFGFGAAEGAAAAAAGRPATLLRFEGTAASVAWRIAALRRRVADFGGAEELDEAGSRALWQALRDAAPFAGRPAAPLWRVSVAPAAGATLAEAAAALPCQWFLDWAGGLAWIEVEPGAEAPADGGAAVLRAAVAAAGGGHATLLRGTEALRRAVPVFEPEPPALAALTRRVKERFDPARILNRGRMYEGV